MVSDSITLNAMSGGSTVDTEYIAGRTAHLQRIKVVTGAVDTDGGDVSSSNPLPVTLANTGANATAIKVDGSAVTQPVSGTVTVNALPAGTNSIGTVNIANVEVNQSVTSATTIFTQDCVSPTPLRWVNLQLLAPVAWSGVTVQFEGSNDNATWNSVQLLTSNASNTGTVTNASAVGVFNGPIPYRYFRARVSGYTSGTVQAIAEFSPVAATPLNAQLNVVQGNSNWSMNVAQVNGATTATAASGIQKVGVTDGTGTALTSTGSALDVNLKTSSITVNTSAAQSGTWTVQPGNTQNTTAWLVQDTPATSGGLSKYHLVSAASTNTNNVKASAGQVYTITAFNVNASARYLKFHNTASTPTAGSGVTDTFLIPGNASGAGVVINIDKGIAFSTGIGISITGGIADADTTAISASDVVVNIYYK